MSILCASSKLDITSLAVQDTKGKFFGHIRHLRCVTSLKPDTGMWWRAAEASPLTHIAPYLLTTNVKTWVRVSGPYFEFPADEISMVQVSEEAFAISVP